MLRSRFRRSSGFSLVEIMVGMVIGMFGIMIMLQVFSLAEGQKRSTTSGGDAQTSGAIALFGIQRDIRQAGLGLTDVKLIACNLTLRTGVVLNTLAPVTINHASIPAGDANTDTLLVVYGSSNGSPQGDGITSQSSQAVYLVQTPSSFTSSLVYATADKVIAAPPSRASPCTLTLDWVVPPAAGANTATAAVNTGVTSMTNGTLFNVGQSPKVLAYAVRSSNLTQCDYTVNDCSAAGSVNDSTVWVPIANNIVSLRARYGRDTNSPMDGIADVWDRTAMAAMCDVAKVSAIQLALVARSANFEKTAVTASTAAANYPTWEGTASASINVTGLTNWQNYRYRVFQSTVPIRNMAWAGAQSGC
ncbi:MAG TPA: PilW family protein [Burkholderiales bacterium]|jgi:type IV pilus assembly protein PilW